jgi:transposase InsO family protein
MKKERIYRREYKSIDDVKKDVFDYIELFYNRKRLHSVLGYMSTVECRYKYDVENIV